MINAVVIAVILMIILCLCRLNVVISLFISALVGGLISGMNLEKVINVFGKNIVDGAEVALSYALLGGFAALISYSGITDYLVGKIIASIHAENSRLSRVKVKIIIIIALLAMDLVCVFLTCSYLMVSVKFSIKSFKVVFKKQTIQLR